MLDAAKPCWNNCVDIGVTPKVKFTTFSPFLNTSADIVPTELDKPLESKAAWIVKFAVWHWGTINGDKVTARTTGLPVQTKVHNNLKYCDKVPSTSYE